MHTLQERRTLIKLMPPPPLSSQSCPSTVLNEITHELLPLPRTPEVKSSADGIMPSHTATALTAQEYVREQQVPHQPHIKRDCILRSLSCLQVLKDINVHGRPLNPQRCRHRLQVLHR
jgi:hypothetical protein